MSNQKQKPWQFQPGMSGNPKGRPKLGLTLAETAREKVTPGEVVDVYLEAMRDTAQPMALRLTAAAWLGDRGWGKAAQIIELVGPASEVDPSRLTPAQLEMLERLLADAAPGAVIDVESSDAP